MQSGGFGFGCGFVIAKPLIADESCAMVGVGAFWVFTARVAFRRTVARIDHDLLLKKSSPVSSSYHSPHSPSSNTSRFRRRGTKIQLVLSHAYFQPMGGKLIRIMSGIREG